MRKVNIVLQYVNGGSMKKYIYVDYENMGNIKTLPTIEGKYFFFIGDKQNSIPKSLVLASNTHKIEWVEIGGDGKNALDFHIAYYLAKNEMLEDVTHYVLSKDKGFDPLISFINKQQKTKVKRVVSINDIPSKEVKNQEEHIANSGIQEKCDKLIKNLESIAKNKRPKSEKTLKAHINSLFKNELKDNDVQKLLDHLYRSNIISKGNNNRLSYSI